MPRNIADVDKPAPGGISASPMHVLVWCVCAGASAGFAGDMVHNDFTIEYFCIEAGHAWLVT